ncbi:Sel1-like repeat-containing protein kinase family protein [Agitococcus lubricus]|uniref:Protein kinase-like protein n=1 Tax=Agitococcus lubricus TaxID=1077255 RepID=A0A2T5J175_9GAMM|nr:SEL1-like repeat protein [Agitococcus lubricus]PTQ90141.1 protein kinase-like protein [Agitococcus lubricus]
MKTVANLFANTHTVLGADQQKDRHFITIERLAIDEDGKCTFMKSVEGLAQNEYWIAREKNILMLLKKTPHIVRLRKEEEKTETSYQTVKTRDAGLSLAQWLCAKPLHIDGQVPLKHPFYPVVNFLLLAKYAITALKHIHQMGVIHAHLRPDNICIPYLPTPYHFDSDLQLDIENLALIDFMFAISHTLKLSRAIPISTNTEGTQSRLLLNALEEDRQTRLAEKIQRVDYSVDMFALGVILEQVFQQDLLYPPDRQAELSMEIHQLIQELKSYDKGIPDSIKRKYFHLLPHDGYLKHIDYLLALDNKALAPHNYRLRLDPTQFLDDDMSLSSTDTTFAPEIVTMTTNQQPMNPNTQSVPDSSLVDSHIELNKGVVISLIVTAQIIFFFVQSGNELGLDVLASSSLVLVVGILAALACKMLTKSTPSTNNITTTNSIKTETTPMQDHDDVVSAQESAADVVELSKGVVIPSVITLMLMFFIYSDGNQLNLDILSSMMLILLCGGATAFAGKLFGTPPAPQRRPATLARNAVPSSDTEDTSDAAPVVVAAAATVAAVSQQTLELDEIDAIAQAELHPSKPTDTPTTPETEATDTLSTPTPDTTETLQNKTDMPEPTSHVTNNEDITETSATNKPEAISVSPEVAAALQEDSNHEPPAKLLTMASAPVKEKEDELISVNKWAVIAVLVALQLGYEAYTLLDLKQDNTSTAATPEPAPALAVEATPAEEPAELLPTEEPPVDDVAAANIALLSEASSVSTPEVATVKNKKETPDSVLLSGSPSTPAPKVVKEKAPKPEKPAKETVTQTTSANDNTATTTEVTEPAPVATPAVAPATVATETKPAPAAETKPAEKPTPKSLTRGLAEAQNTMGWHYYHGDGVKRDYEEAFKWFQKAANLGEPSAQFNIGMMYASGTGTKQDFSEAAKWYKKAAEQGKTSAQLNLGMMYISGRGVRQNIDEGVKWLGKAADQGDTTAKANLTWLVQQGYIKGETEPTPVENKAE